MSESESQLKSCELSGFWSWMAQIALFTVAFFSVFCLFFRFILIIIYYFLTIVMRVFSKHKRPLRIWSYDVLKQTLGSILAHFFQFFVALFMTTPAIDGCIWFLTGYHLDCVLGVTVCQILRKQVDKFADKDAIRYKWMKTGYYGQPPKANRFWKQTGIWMVIIFISQCVCLLTLTIFKHPLIILHQFITKPLQNHPQLAAIIIMGVYPIIMSSVVFTIQDQLLARGKDQDNLTNEESQVDLKGMKKKQLRENLLGNKHIGQQQNGIQQSDIKSDEEIELDEDFVLGESK